MPGIYFAYAENGKPDVGYIPMGNSQTIRCGDVLGLSTAVTGATTPVLATASTANTPNISNDASSYTYGVYGAAAEDAISDSAGYCNAPNTPSNVESASQPITPHPTGPSSRAVDAASRRSMLRVWQFTDNMVFWGRVATAPTYPSDYIDTLAGLTLSGAIFLVKTDHDNAAEKALSIVRFDRSDPAGTKVLFKVRTAFQQYETATLYA